MGEGPTVPGVKGQLAQTKHGGRKERHKRLRSSQPEERERTWLRQDPQGFQRWLGG